jgi:predicted unusual protein kinase regulating ubiquinone biosynthesis (AarF/ABC1/UbiB family)
LKKEKKWYRMWKILSFALSVFLRVYWYKVRKKSDEEWDILWEKIGAEFRQTLFELEGLLIKVGQMLSIRADLLPNSFIKQIEDLVDQVPPSNWDDIRKVLEEEWQAPVKDKLLDLHPKAIASASIGEVFRGKLPDGTDVAVKVQRPNIQSIVQTDFRSLAIIIWFADHFAPVPKGFISFKQLFKELKQVIERELDFKKEMQTAIHFEQRFKEFNGLKIPVIFPKLCSSRVLVMEWVDGYRVTDVQFLEQHEINRPELSQRLFRLFLPQWLEAGMFHADPHAGNVLVKEDGTLVLLDFGMVGEISKADAAGFQNLLEAILLKNYPKAAKVLVDLGFLQPEANLKIIEKMLADALAIDLNQLKEMDLFSVKKQMNNIIKSLPIQVPTRFVFLGRSFVTIEGMLHTISPDKEIIEIIKPAFMDWLDKSETNKWKLFLKWVNSLPVFQLFHAVTDLLEKPKLVLEQKETQQLRELQFTIFENQKKYSFYLGLIGLVGAFAGIYLKEVVLWGGAGALCLISGISYIVLTNKQRKWLKRGA